MKQHSEVVALGGLTGQGFRNLLGRPHLRPVELLLREAVQNSWDARKRQNGGQIRFGIRIRDLKPKEDRVFRATFTQEKAGEPRRSNTLLEQLSRPTPIRVMELADYGTVGLCGEDRPGEPTGGAPSRFVNFFFDVGRAHEESGDGGTYGFGRSSLYLAGKASLVVVDTLAVEGGGLRRRVMGCRIGESFEVKAGRGRGRYTGRHFWGGGNKPTLEPLRDEEASGFAAAIGLPTREGAGKSGTTIVIPWPVGEVDDPEQIVNALMRGLWPKMVPEGNHTPIVFEIERDGERIESPRPEKHPEYKLFVQALRAARGREEAALVRPIVTLKPKRLTGHLGLAVTAADAMPYVPPEPPEEADDAPAVQRPINSIALMRPTELVVKYLKVAGADQADQCWAGVFICDDADEVRTAFALAEPPAHDDWIAERLVEKTARYLVRKTLQALLPEAVRDMLGIASAGSVKEGGSRLSLGMAAERFSRAFLAGDGQGAAATERTNPGNSATGRGASRRSGIRMSALRPIGIELVGEERVARYRLTLRGQPGERIALRGSPAIVAEGALDIPPVSLTPPVIVGWEGGVPHGGACEVTMAAGAKDVDVLVAIRGDYAVMLEVTGVEGATPEGETE